MHHMEMIEVRTMNYYNKPRIYPFMPKEIFSILEEAFLNDLEFASVPKTLFDEMIDCISTAEVTNLTCHANTSSFSNN